MTAPIPETGVSFSVLPQMTSPPLRKIRIIHHLPMSRIQNLEFGKIRETDLNRKFEFLLHDRQPASFTPRPSKLRQPKTSIAPDCFQSQRPSRVFLSAGFRLSPPKMTGNLTSTLPIHLREFYRLRRLISFASAQPKEVLSFSATSTEILIQLRCHS